VSLLITIWFCWRNLKKGLRLEEIEVGGSIILKQAFKFERQASKWIDVFQNGDNWFAFVNTVMNI